MTFLKMQIDAYKKGIKYLNECGTFTFDKYKEAHRIAKSPVDETQLRDMWDSCMKMWSSETMRENTIDMFTRLLKKSQGRMAT